MPQLLTADNLSLGAETNGNQNIKSKLGQASHSEASWDRINDDLSTMSLVSDMDNLSETGTQRDRSRTERADEYFVVCAAGKPSDKKLFKLPMTYDEVIKHSRVLLQWETKEYLVCPVTLSIDFAGGRVPFDDLDWTVVRHGSKLIINKIDRGHPAVGCSPLGSQVVIRKAQEGQGKSVLSWEEDYCYRTKPGETVGEFKSRITVRLGFQLHLYRLSAPGQSGVLYDGDLMTHSLINMERNEILR